MLLSFLEQQHRKLTEEKRQKEEELRLATTRIKETQAFLRLLEEERTEPFTEFSPRVIDAKDQSKRDEQKEALSEATNRRIEILNLIDALEDELHRLDDAIEEAKTLVPAKETGKAKENVSSAEAVQEEMSPEEEMSSNRQAPGDAEQMRVMLENALGFLPHDPMRAKLELEKIGEKLEPPDVVLLKNVSRETSTS